MAGGRLRTYGSTSGESGLEQDCWAKCLPIAIHNGSGLRATMTNTAPGDHDIVEDRFDHRGRLAHQRGRLDDFDRPVCSRMAWAASTVRSPSLEQSRWSCTGAAMRTPSTLVEQSESVHGSGATETRRRPFRGATLRGTSSFSHSGTSSPLIHTKDAARGGPRLSVPGKSFGDGVSARGPLALFSAAASVLGAFSCGGPHRSGSDAI